MQDIVKHKPKSATRTIKDLGWSPFFSDQIDAKETHLLRLRIATVHRSRVTAESENGVVKINLPARSKTTDFAVGDWVLADPLDDMFVRRLDRHTLLDRHTEGATIPQLIAANIDTLFIVTSCNDDFNPARLERYLTLANESGANPVIVLTKADQVDDATPFQDQATALQRDLSVVSLNAKSDAAIITLAPWCGSGQTVALVGSSGVGKSTLLNTLAGKEVGETGGIREDDAKGRHTTTSRSLHPIKDGGLVIDTPGMRTLHIRNVSTGLDVLFAEITELTPNCRFRDCSHINEPKCAVQAAIKDGSLDPTRVDRWRKLSEENLHNPPVATGPTNNKIIKSRGKRR